MRINYSKPVAITFIALPILNFGLALLTGKIGIMILIGSVMMLLVGVLYLVRPYFEVYSNEIVMVSPLGNMSRRFPFESGSLRIEKGRIWANTKALPVRRWMADKADWAKLSTRNVF